MIDESAFIDRIAAAVLAGRRKRRIIPDEHYARLQATLKAQDVARKLPGLFRADTIRIREDA